MKALADENFPRAAVNELRRLGWDIVVVQDWRPTISAWRKNLVKKAEFC